MTTGKTIALTIQTFVGKVMSLPFNMLSRFKDGVAEKIRVSERPLLVWSQVILMSFSGVLNVSTGGLSLV